MIFIWSCIVMFKILCFHKSLWKDGGCNISLLYSTVQVSPVSVRNRSQHHNTNAATADYIYPRKQLEARRQYTL